MPIIYWIFNKWNVTMETGWNRLIQKSTPKEVILINGMDGEFIEILGNF
jgi:hypothetical protein